MLNSLLKYFQNDENTAKELSKFIMETREVKEHFQNKRRLTFFSLSPDLSNISDNWTTLSAG